jgi:hypothetical protein
MLARVARVGRAARTRLRRGKRSDSSGECEQPTTPCRLLHSSLASMSTKTSSHSSSSWRLFASSREISFLPRPIKRKRKTSGLTLFACRPRGLDSGWTSQSCLVRPSLRPILRTKTGFVALPEGTKRLVALLAISSIFAQTRANRTLGRSVLRHAISQSGPFCAL